MKFSWKVMELGHPVLRYGLALVIGWIGMIKFTGYEAAGIQPLVAHSHVVLLGAAIWSLGEALNACLVGSQVRRREAAAQRAMESGELGAHYVQRSDRSTCYVRQQTAI